MAYYPLPENHSCSDNESVAVDNSSLLQFVTGPKNGSLANETTDVSCSSVDDDDIPRPNTALMSLILTLTTFLLALALKEFRNSHFLGRNVSVLQTACEVELGF